MAARRVYERPPEAVKKPIGLDPRRRLVRC